MRKERGLRKKKNRGEINGRKDKLKIEKNIESRCRKRSTEKRRKEWRIEELSWAEQRGEMGGGDEGKNDQNLWWPSWNFDKQFTRKFTDKTPFNASISRFQ